MIRYQTVGSNKAGGVKYGSIIDPTDKTVAVFILENGQYIAKSFGESGTAPVNILEGCEISLPDVFAE